MYIEHIVADDNGRNLLPRTGDSQEVTSLVSNLSNDTIDYS